MPDEDRVVADEDVFDHEAHDSLALDHIKCVGGAAQTAEERGECLGQAQEREAIGSLVSDRLRLGAQRLFALPQQGHAFAQLVERQEFLLIGVEKPFDAFAHTGEFSLQALLTFLGWLGRARCSEAAVQLLLDQRWVLEQSDHLGPDDLIEQILAHHAVVAHRATQLSPAVRADAFVVVELARARVCRGAGERVPALLAADQPLYDAWRDRATPRAYFVLVEEFLGSREALLA